MSSSVIDRDSARLFVRSYLKKAYFIIRISNEDQLIDHLVRNHCGDRTEKIESAVDSFISSNVKSNQIILS